MIFVCPKPPIWCDTVTRCRNAWEASGHTGEEPPWPLVLSGWIYSSDLDKQQRWRALVRWAEQKDLARLLPQLSEDDGYYVHDLSTSYPEQHYGPQTHPPAVCPSEQELAEALQRLRDAWPDVAGPGLADACHPSEFAGAKARRLIVTVTQEAEPPWGSWFQLASGPERHTFTAFRQRINETIEPHHVDHVDFKLETRDA